MAMRQSTGLFGKSEMKPVLQDGWMLTSLDVTEDSKTAETLTAVAALVSAATTGKSPAGAAKAPGAAPKGKSGAPSDLSTLFTRRTGILRPGLYRFDYDESGLLTGLTPVEFFTGAGIVRPTADGRFPGR